LWLLRDLNLSYDKVIDKLTSNDSSFNLLGS